ncbi:MAG: hypothetical protein AAF089_04255 [Bacteroidota bacterium]
MREWNDRKSVVVPLGVLAVTVWAYVLYTLVAAWPASEPEVPGPTLRTAEGIVTVAHVWGKDFRDPFSGAERPGASVASVQLDAPATPDVAVRLRLIGVVDGTAMLEQPDGAVILVRRGAQVDGGRVTSMTSETIVLRIQGRTQTLTLE